MDIKSTVTGALLTAPLSAHIHKGPACSETSHNSTCAQHPGAEVSCHALFFGLYACVHQVN